jgi:antitoxin FitA-like protein
MPKSITVRDLPPQTHAELKRRAAEKGQSLQQFLLGFVIQLAETPDPVVELERHRQRTRQADTTPEADS